MSKKKLSYQESITEIEEILKKVETEQLDVDEISENVQKVYSLIKQCRERLHETETEIEKILNEMEA